MVEGHITADSIEGAIRAALPDSDVVAHLEPRSEGLALRDRVLAVALAEPLVREAHDITLYEHDGRVSVSVHLTLPHNTPLDEAHAVAERVEAALRAEPEVDDAQPLAHPLTAGPPSDDDVLERERITRATLAAGGREPRGSRPPVWSAV